VSDTKGVGPLLQPSEQVALPPSDEHVVAPIHDEAEEIRSLLTHYLAAAHAQSKPPT
jgi:hypothetical protein